MTGLIMKLIACLILIVLATQLLPQIYYPTIYQAIGVGIVLALMAHVMELFVLREGTFWISTVADFVVAAVLLYFSQSFIQSSYVTISGAIITAAVLSVIEYFVHAYLILSRKVSST
ncbi:DUF2512 family protein [Pelosinus sp. IPA-1]|uniref:DUF2512 family protein n=1 Tax=Pelosinus sp. IPA-1 TaxID=3029569 RepID=UPI002553C4DC|nr:DUF2512 family protein [Pelosinus sp. IPA-1]